MARRFVFSLEPMLTLRRRAEEEVKKAFALATRAVAEERERRERLEEAHRGAQQDIVELYGRGQVAFDLVRAAYRDANHLSQSIQESRQRQSQLEERQEQFRALLVEAQRERRAVEILREKREAEHKAEEDRREQAELDETSIRMHARRRREPE